MTPEPNIITEIYPGHYHVLLDFPHPSDAVKLISPEIPYVWLSDFEVCRSSWQKIPGELFPGAPAHSAVKSRRLVGDFLMETDAFVQCAPAIRQTLHLVQLPKPPPYYLELSRFKEAGLYRALAEIGDYHLKLLIPGAADFAPLVSRDRSVLEAAVAKLAAGG